MWNWDHEPYAFLEAHKFWQVANLALIITLMSASTPPGLNLPEFTGFQKCIRLVIPVPHLLSVPLLGTYNYGLATFLCNFLEPYIPSHYNALDTFSNFVPWNQPNIHIWQIPLITYECIDLAVNYILKGKPGLKISYKDLIGPFSPLLQLRRILCFNKGIFYDQIDGVAMDSPFASVLANLFMGHRVF